MQNLPVFAIQPSVICCDLCNLEQEIRRWENAGVQSLHVDVLDGAFAPSLPVGIDTFFQLSKRTALPFDVHIMSLNNKWFIEQCLRMRPARICFQAEQEKDPEDRLRQIREAGIPAGIALSPTTPFLSVKALIDQADYLLLMRIKPGYAGFADEAVTIDMEKRIEEARRILDAERTGRDIIIDGRVTLQDIRDLRKLGATCFVGGSRSLFSSEDYADNYLKACSMYMEE